METKDGKQVKKTKKKKKASKIEDVAKSDAECGTDKEKSHKKSKKHKSPKKSTKKKNNADKEKANTSDDGDFEKTKRYKMTARRFFLQEHGDPKEGDALWRKMTKEEKNAYKEKVIESRKKDFEVTAADEKTQLREEASKKKPSNEKGKTKEEETTGARVKK